MPEFPKLPIITPPPAQKFPELPILEPDPPRMTLREKYGGLLYFGIAGLLFSLFLIGAFFYGLYQARDLFAAVYVLNEPNASDPERYEAAWLIAHDPHANDAQRMNLILDKRLPDLARYIVAEGLTPDSIRADPKGYALMAAKSEGWPDWLRLMVARPMAYAVGQGYRIAWEPLDELRARSDKAIVLWMTYTRAAMGPGDEAARKQLAEVAGHPGGYQELAKLLDEAVNASGAERVAKLDAATAWLRVHHPPSAQVWDGWEVRDGHLAAKLAPISAGPVPAAAADKAPPR